MRNLGPHSDINPVRLYLNVPNFPPLAEQAIWHVIMTANGIVTVQHVASRHSRLQSGVCDETRSNRIACAMECNEKQLKVVL